MPYIAASPLFLVALSAAGAYCIMGLAWRSGLGDLNDKIAAEFPTRMPGFDTDGTLASHYTGNARVNQQLAGIVRFFATMTSGELQPLSLFSFWFSGQALAGLVIMTLDGLRAGNRGKAISYTALWGLCYQTITYGITIPIYVAIWLWTSPLAYMTATETPAREVAAALALDDADLSVMPHALIWGYILPTLLAGLPSPAVVSPEQKNNYLLIWQLFPVWTSLVQLLLSTAARRLRPRPGSEAAAATATVEGQKKALTHRLRWVYIFTLTVTTVIHVFAVLYAVVPSLRPESLAPLDPTAVTLVNTFKPAQTPFEAVRPVKSLADGILLLLQYDVYFAGAAFLYWASCQFRAATEAPTLSSVLIVLTGPIGAALTLMWRRDERLLLDNDEPKAKTN
ncbi:hypothetical protein RB594_006016 [Gaeumannomyces avenae]